jgi:hypothetical protein
VKPEELNLSQGLAKTLVDKIYIQKAKEAQLSGNIAIEAVRKRKATAEEHLRSHNKHVAAGMLAAAGKFQLSEDNGDLVRDRVQEKEHHEFNKQLQRKDSYNALHAKVQEIENSNLPPEKWNQRQLKIMLCWYKREGDDKLPTQGARSAC